MYLNVLFRPKALEIVFVSFQFYSAFDEHNTFNRCCMITFPSWSIEIAIFKTELSIPAKPFRKNTVQYAIIKKPIGVVNG